MDYRVEKDAKLFNEMLLL